MNKLVATFTITSITTAFLINVSAQDLEEIFVTERHIEETIPLDLARYGNRVEIITSEQIVEHGFNDISQTIQMLVPGLHIAPKNGPFDYFTGSMQGSRSQDILWLIDGVRISNRLYNSTMPLDTVPAHMVERIEVLKGGQGIFYGTQSVSGVVNIVTKSFRSESDGAINVGAHTNDGYNVSGHYRGSTGNHEYVVYASRDEADGFQAFTDADTEPSATDRERGYEVNNVGVKYAYNYDEASRFMVHYQYTDNNVDFARPTDTDQAFNDREENLFSIKLDHRFTEDISVFVKGYYHSWDSYFTQSDNDLTNPGSFISIDDNSFWGYEDYGLNAQGKVRTDMGVEYVIGYDHQNFSGRDDVLLIADQEESVNAVFFQLRSTEDLFDNTALAVGVRHNEQSDAGGTTVWNISGKHDINDSLYLNGNIGTAFRLPDAWQLFGNDPCCTMGNPALEGEESFNINVGLGGYMNVAQGLTWETIGFHRTVDNLIGSANGFRINSTNEVKMVGGELIASLALTPEWQSTVDFVYTNAEEKGSNEQIADIPKTSLKWAVDYRPEQMPLGLSLSLVHVGEVASDVGGFFATGQNAEHGDYTVVDLSGFYLLGSDEKHRIGFRAENLLDEDYSTSIRMATRDNGIDYLYGNRGVPMTFHVNYSYQF